MSGRGGGKSGAQLTAELHHARDQAELTTRCALCGWTYTGTAHEGRELAKGHRRVHHPDAIQSRRNRTTLTRFGKTNEWRQEGLANAQDVAAMLERAEGRVA